ncbi:MAG: acyl-ACP thioesterase domain-containing protein [Rikenellaceae bacterium]
MSITPTTYTIIIEQQNTDFTFRASISTLISNVLNVAGLDAEAKGFGVSALNEDNQTWVLSRFAIEVDYLPKVFEKIKITTWISDYHRLITTRNFTLSNEKGEIFGGAVSQWCMLDTNARRAIDLSKLHENYNDYVLGEYGYPIDKPRRILAVEPSQTIVHRAVYSDIDFNKHVNALRYFDLMLDMLPIEMLAKANSLRVDLQYIHECYLADTLSVNYQQQDNVSMFEIKRNEDISAVKCMIEWRP